MFLCKYTLDENIKYFNIPKASLVLSSLNILQRQPVSFFLPQTALVCKIYINAIIQYVIFCPIFFFFTTSCLQGSPCYQMRPQFITLHCFEIFYCLDIYSVDGNLNSFQFWIVRHKISMNKKNNKDFKNKNVYFIGFLWSHFVRQLHIGDSQLN